MSNPRLANGWGMLLLSLTAAVASAQDVDPFPMPPVLGPTLYRWSFQSDDGGWRAVHGCRVSAQSGALRIVSEGEDPYVAARLERPIPGPLWVKLKIRSTIPGSGQFFWTTDRLPHTDEKHSSYFAPNADGQWHEYAARLDVEGRLQSLRLDPGSGLGQAEVAWIELQAMAIFPIVIERIEATADTVKVLLRNRSAAAVSLRVAGQSLTIAAGATAESTCPVAGKTALEAVELVVEIPGFPSLSRTVVVCRPETEPVDGWLVSRSDRLTLSVAPDGRGAKVYRGGKLAAVLAPLVMAEGKLRTFQLAERKEGMLRLTGEGTEVVLDVRGEEIRVAIDSQQPVEGPVVRAIGPLQQGLLAGLEYLGKGERSSSTLDIETEEHLRFAPDLLKVTMPLMTCVTDRASVAVGWSDMSLQPTFACPNFVDGMSNEHRMSLRGRKIVASVRVSDGDLEDAILWAVRRGDSHNGTPLPPLPTPPRDAKAQAALCMAAFEGPCRGEGGWGHCAEPSYPRRPVADVASAIFRLTGQPPQLDKVIPGGGHVRNDSIYFVTGRVREWLAMRRAEARGLMSRQRPDGSFAYQGKYLRGHYEDTASGHCAMPATSLLELARLTGDREALAAGLKALEYMKRFREPRGAQTWELSLHTPDILASAYLVWAYVRGYELTGKAEYLECARRWALTGVPFVYQWQRYPIMLYATPPVYGATNYRSPNWIGLPVQWCGGVYAYSLVLLAAHDSTLDWKHLARGILITAQQMQYPEGPRIGCLPDVFRLPSQNREGPSINPSALVCLDLALQGKVDGLAVAAEGSHRVAAPYPVVLRDNRARISAPRGMRYQVLIDGEIHEIAASQGEDEIPCPVRP